jgi:YbgC/YbaW family acyl-CoA thioester hydrolase
MSFRHQTTVRFNEVDRAGIAFFGRVFEYCHEAFEEMMMAGGDALQRCFEEEGWGMPLVHAEADYKRPMRMGERLQIELEVERVGGTSLSFGYRVLGAEGDLRATVRLVHAFVSLEDFRPSPVPERMLALLGRLQLWAV